MKKYLKGVKKEILFVLEAILLSHDIEISHSVPHVMGIHCLFMGK